MSFIMAEKETACPLFMNPLSNDTLRFEIKAL